MQIAALAPLSAAGESVKVVTAGSSSNDWQLRMEYVAYIEGDGDASFGLSSTLPAGSQTIHLNFEVQLELPDNLPSSRTLVAHIGLGQDADYWATDGNDVFFGIGLDPKDAGVGVRFNGADRVPFTSFGTELSRAAARVSLEITTPAGFRTGAAPAELSYTYTVKVDFDEDGQADFTSTGSYMDTKWAIQLHFGLERWWVGAGSTASQTPLRASLNTDNVVPTLRTATVNGATLVLTYDEALDTTSMPAEGDFIVEVDDTQVNLANTNPVAVSGMTVTLTLQTAVTNNRQTVTLDYTAGTNPIQDLAGNDASNLTDQAVTNSTADATGPMLNTATVSGAILTLTYDEELDTGSVPEPDDFTVTVDNSPATPTSVSVIGNAVTLDLATAVTPGQTVTVSYIAGTNPIRDLAGNDAANLDNQPAVELYVPRNFRARGLRERIVYTWAAPWAGNVGGYEIRYSADMSFPEAMTTTVPLAATVTRLNQQNLTAGTTYFAQIRAQDGSDTFGPWSYTLKATPDNDQIANPSPVAPGAPGVSARTGALMVTWTAPDDRGNTIVRYNVRYIRSDAADKSDIQWTYPPNDEWQIGRDAPTALSYTITGLDGGVSYDVQVSASNGNGASGWSPTTAGMPADNVVPMLNTATVLGAILTLTYDEELDTGSVPEPDDFTVTVDNSPATPTSVSVIGNAVTLDLATAVTPGQTVTVSYIAGTNPIRDAAGNDAANLDNQPAIPLPAAGESVKVATADGTGNDYQYKQEYVAFIEGDDDASFGLSSTLPAGSQTIYLNFEVQLELPDNLPSNRTLVAWIGLGHDASFSSDNDVLFGIGLDPENALVKVREQSMAETATSFASELSRAAARVSLEITTPVGFRTSGEGELSYTYTVKVDFDRDGQTDFISTGSYMDSRWGVNLQLGLERWWSGAGSTAGEQPLRASLHVVGTTGMPDPTDPAAEALGLRSVASGTTATRIKIIWRSSATNVPRYIVQWRRTADQEFSDTERRAVIDCGTNCNSFPTKSYVITGLMAGTEYSIQVTTGILSGSIRTFTRPDIPENFQVTGRVGQITVAWNEVRGARFYRVQWVTGSESFEQDSPVYEEILMTPPARTAGDPPIRKFSASFDSGEEGGVLHKVRVAGVAANDLSGEWAGPLSAILLTLPSVRNLTLTPGDSILTVTWDPPEGGYPPGQSVSVQFYQVSYRPVGSNAWRSGLQVLNRKVIQGLTNGREYEVRIRAFIIPTGVITAGPLTATPAVPPFDPNKPRLPGIPRNLSLTAGDGWIQASWDPPDDLGNPPLHGYMVVYRRGAETNNAIWLWSNGTNTRFTIRGLTNGQKYVVGVLANSTLGLGPEAGALSATPQATGPSRPDSELPRPRPPSKPRNLSLVPGDGQIEVSWDEPLDRGEPDFRRYLVKYREVQQTEQTWEDWYSDWYCWLFSGCPPPGPEPDTTPKRWLEVGLYYDTDVLIEWLKNGTTYEVQVKVFNIHGEAVAGPKQATPQQQPEPVRRPGMPRNLTLTPADGSITVSWDPPAGTVPVDGYRVRYIRAKSSHFIGGSITTVKGTSTVLRGANGQYYSAKVAAYNSAGTGPETPAASAAPAPA